MRLVMLMALVSACAPTFRLSSSTLTGILVDVSWEGFIFDSCELGIQYGGASSAIEYVSSRDKAVCNIAKALVGKTVTIDYEHYMFSGQTDQNDIVTSIK